MKRTLLAIVAAFLMMTSAYAQRLANVQAEAETLLPCVFVQRVDIPARLADIGTGSLDHMGAEAYKQVFQAHNHVVFFRHRNHLAIKLQIDGKFLFLGGAGDGVYHQVPDAEIPAHLKADVQGFLHILVDVLAFFCPDREGGVCLEKLHAVFFARFFDGFVVRVNFFHRFVVKAGGGKTFLDPFADRRAGEAEVHGVETALGKDAERVRSVGACIGVLRCNSQHLSSPPSAPASAP